MAMGVPQGSVLRPLLYIVYVNDVSVPGTIMYADDTSLIIRCNSVADISCETSSRLDDLNLYLKSNDLMLNRQKTVLIEFKALNRERRYSHLVRIDHVSVAQVEHATFLGIVLDSNLNWHEHINMLCKKLNSICFVLNRLKGVVNCELLKMFYFAHFHSTMSYGAIAWGISPEINRVFVIQKRVIRTMCGLKPGMSCRDVFRTIGIMTVPCIFIFQLLLYAKNNINDLIKLSNYHSYNTRNAETLEVPAHRLSFTERGPRYLATKVYNRLPGMYKTMPLKDFRTNVKKLLMLGSYYSLAEYLSPAN
jgi:hypothetical protein